MKQAPHTKFLTDRDQLVTPTTLPCGESFFSTLEIACFSCIEAFYNPVRLQSAIGYQSPIYYEQQTAQETAVIP